MVAGIPLSSPQYLKKKRLKKVLLNLDRGGTTRKVGIKMKGLTLIFLGKVLSQLNPESLSP